MCSRNAPIICKLSLWNRQERVQLSARDGKQFMVSCSLWEWSHHHLFRWTRNAVLLSFFFFLRMKNDFFPKPFAQTPLKIFVTKAFSLKTKITQLSYTAKKKKNRKKTGGKTEEQNILDFFLSKETTRLPKWIRKLRTLSTLLSRPTYLSLYD